MPQFVYDPANKEAQYVNVSNAGLQGFSESGFPKPSKNKGKGKGKGSNGAGAAQPAATVETPAKNPSKGGKGNKGGKGGKGRKPSYNPLYEPFLTPKQIREQAAALASAGTLPEGAIQQKYAAEQAGLAGLTTALSSRLGDVAAQQTAALKGFGDVYGGAAQQAQTAGQSALAAAGAAPSAAPGGTPAVNEALTRSAYTITGYQPAAEAIGARLGASSMANLRNALVERASKVSADTAKYIQSLSDRELQRAISGESVAQNAARLNLSAQGQQWDQQVDAERLRQSQEGLNLRARSLELQVQKAANQYAPGTAKSVASAQSSLVQNASKYTSPQKKPSGLYEFQIQVPATDSNGNRVFKSQTIQAPDQQTADKIATDSGASGALMTGAAYTMVVPTRTQATARFVSILAPYMGKQKASKWVASHAAALGLDSLS